LGLTKWIGSKLIVYLMVFVVFYIIGEMMGWTPKALKDIVSWFANNFLLISILLMFTMGFWIMLRLTSKPKRSQPT